MDIIFEGKYKSITKFIWNDVPEFCVITGPNGVGKTQLLELIYYSFGQVDQLYSYMRIPRSQWKIVTIRGLNITHPNEIVFRRSAWNFLENQVMNVQFIQNATQNLWEQFQNYRENERNTQPNYKQFFDDITSKLRKDIFNISEKEFYAEIPLYWNSNVQELLTQSSSNSFSQIFYDYHLKKAEFILQKKSDEEFRKLYGTPPWIILNEILKETKLPFEVNNPEDISLRGNFKFLVRNTETNELIEFKDLSSGEKILFSICFWLYNSQEIKKLPRLILLDEPDAHLHPSMARMFIDAINNIIVKRENVRVIMTTHSPSTVAFTPVDSLIEMKRSTPRFVKISTKNRAINNLTSGLITVGKNTKFVLVEDEIDAEFYSAIYSDSIEKELINPDIPIVFIPSNKNNNNKNEGGGGKNEVKKWVDKLRENELSHLFQGIIDKDYGNIETNGIYVLSRYSIENYLLDPLVIFALLLDNEVGYDIPNINLKLGEEYKIKQLTKIELQNIADYIHGGISPLLTGLSSEDTVSSLIKITNSIELQYPNWLLNMRGKDLLSKYSYKFGQRIVKIDTLLKMYKKLLIYPVDLIDLFQKIQECS